MNAIIIGAVSGIVFGIGLAISGMYDPAVVLGFLDVGAMPSGGWDPSLAFVMVGALAVTIPAFAFARKRSTPIGASAFQAPSAAGIEPRLLVGSALFGVGWGLVGYCPGPALAALGLGQSSNIAFVGAMAAGMILHRVTVEKS